MTTQNQAPKAMAFYNPKGFVPAFKQAHAFAGEDGRVATLPDIIAARMMSKPGETPWEQYFTTMSAEYVGLSKDGNPIAIVAHGIGPMATLDGVLAAYSHEFKDAERNNRGGRISQEEFLKLESGHYGEVDVIDLTATWNRRPYQFSGHAITLQEIEAEPLWQARLGKGWRDYAKRHASFARIWDRKNGRKAYLDPCILTMDDASNCSYHGREIFDRWMEATPGTAIVHLLSIGGLMNSSHQYYTHDYEKRENRNSLASDVSCHEWWNGTRLLGVRPTNTFAIHPGLPKYSELVEKHLDKLWGQNPKGTKGAGNGFWHLVQMGTRHFTDYPKQGERMDHHEPEFLVTTIEEIPGGPQQFRTTIGGYHGFFKYGIDEVKRIAPPEANAYTIGDIEIEYTEDNPTHHVGPVTFYKVEVDTTQRLVRMEDIYRDYDLMMSLVG